MKQPKILFWDIETSPLIMASFTRYDLRVPYSMVLQEWFVICAAWKWLGDRKIHGVKITDDAKRFAKDFTNDYCVIKALADIVGEADIIVAHNGDHFDWKKFMARLIYHKLPMVKRPIMIDTLKIAKECNFTSNKLDDLGTHLSIGNKLRTQPGLWLGAAKGDKKSIEKMFVYNKGDIPPLEALYNRLKPYAKTHPNLNLFAKTDGCPRCNSVDYQSRGKHYTATQVFHKYQCKSCGHWFRGKTAQRRTEFK